MARGRRPGDRDRRSENRSAPTEFASRSAASPTILFVQTRMNKGARRSGHPVALLRRYPRNAIHDPDPSRRGDLPRPRHRGCPASRPRAGRDGRRARRRRRARPRRHDRRGRPDRGRRPGPGLRHARAGRGGGREHARERLRDRVDRGRGRRPDRGRRRARDARRVRGRRAARPGPGRARAQRRRDRPGTGPDRRVAGVGRRERGGAAPRAPAQGLRRGEPLGARAGGSRRRVRSREPGLGRERRRRCRGAAHRGKVPARPRAADPRAHDGARAGGRHRVGARGAARRSVRYRRSGEPPGTDRGADDGVAVAEPRHDLVRAQPPVAAVPDRHTPERRRQPLQSAAASRVPWSMARFASSSAATSAPPIRCTDRPRCRRGSCSSRSGS